MREYKIHPGRALYVHFCGLLAACLALWLAACRGALDAPPLPPDVLPSEALGQPMPPPPGIVYQTAAGIFITAGSGEPRRLPPQGEVGEGGAASPDGAYRLAREGDAQALVSALDGSRALIWPRDGLNLCPFAWVWGQPALLYTVLLPEGHSPAFTCNRGSPVLFEARRQALTILDATASGLSGPAISPDGSRMAYDIAGEPWLYAFDEGAAPFALAPFGNENLPGALLADPHWSPTGRLLAWTYRLPGADSQGGVVIFDLVQTSASIFTPYDVSAYESFRPQLAFNRTETHLALRQRLTETGSFASQVFSLVDGQARLLDGFFSQWSPQGSWLLVERSPGPADSCRLAVEAPDGDARIPICRGDQAWWSPEEKRLLTYPYNREAFWLTDLDTGATVEVGIPPGAVILGWENP
jgi:hypothetical protein